MRESVRFTGNAGTQARVRFSIIREALGLREESNSDGPPQGASIRENVILEAEMVAFSDTHNKVDGKYLLLGTPCIESYQ